MSSTNPCTTINANADVLGYWVRMPPVIPRIPHTKELVKALHTTGNLSGLRLLLPVTAIVQTAQNHLSAFEGLFVFHILSILISCTIPSSKYNWSKSHIAMVFFTQFPLLGAFVGWGLYFWIYVKDFGTQSECNIMFITIRATTPWLRGLLISSIIGGVVLLVVVFSYTAVQLFTTRSEEEEEEEEANAIARNSTPTAVPAIQAQAETKTPTSRKPWHVEIYHVEIYIPTFFLSIYTITMLELMVHRNTAHLSNGTNLGPGVVQIDHSWQFGQILSVAMIIENVTEFVRFLFRYLARQRRDRRARAREDQAQAVEAAQRAPPPRSNVTYRPRGPAGSSSSSRDSPTSSEYELHNLDKGNVKVSQTIVDPSSQCTICPSARCGDVF